MTSPVNQRLSGLSAAFQDFLARGTLSGVLLVAAAVVALLWANSPWADSYFHLWETPISVGVAGTPVTMSLHHWINDGLMAVFFLLVGLEIKRELLVGELASPRQAALPIAAAVGGMVVPGLVYSIINWGTDGSRGWGIPMATDIAFALGILTLMGPRVPVGLKVFLTALAIVDDVGAVIVIALFYTSQIDITALTAAAGAVVALAVVNRTQVRALAPYLILGIVLWSALRASGIHATIAGVLLALMVPSRTRINALEFSREARTLLDDFDRSETGDLLVLTSKGQQEAVYSLDMLSSAVQAPLLRLEHSLHGLVSFLIMPLFALANAGVALTGMAGVLGQPVTVGVIAGLLIGKPAGIMAFSWLAIRTGVGRMPAQATWRHVHGAAWLAGIGFTMSLFVASLAFVDGTLVSAAKVGILAGSFLAAAVGWQLLARAAVDSADGARSAS